MSFYRTGTVLKTDSLALVLFTVHRGCLGAMAMRTEAVVLANLTALVRMPCLPAVPVATSCSDEAGAVWPDECCGIDDVACEEFLTFVQEATDARMAAAIISPAGERLFRRGFAHKDAHVTATCIRLLDVLTGRANFGDVWASSGTRKRPRAIADDDHHAPRAISDDAHQAAEARLTSLVTAAIACGFSSAAGDAARWAAPREAAVKLGTTLLQQMSDEMAPLYKAVTAALPAKRVLAGLGDATEYVAKACRDLVCVALEPQRAGHAYSAQLQEEVLRWLLMPVHGSPLRESASERDTSPGERAGELTSELAAALGMGEALQEWLGEVEPRAALLAGLLERSLEDAAMLDYAPTVSGCEHNGEVRSSQGRYHIWCPWLLESRVLLMYMRLLPLSLSTGTPQCEL